MGINLEERETVEAGEVFNVARSCVETGAVPRTPHSAVAKATLDQGSSVVSALCTQSGPGSVLMDDQHFLLLNLHLFHPTTHTVK